MHEFGIIEGIFKIIEKTADENKITKISKVKLKIGQMRQVIPEMLQSAFEAVSKNTKAMGAALEIEHVPIIMKCKECGREFVVKNDTYTCPDCGGFKLEVISGQEVVLESVEGERV
ncbi:MAG: hydrogenase maturation nickel metallochaperone HypA [Candidatus Margulisbacteria bacterium]|nr:hydrogenase maturation nickel metallochaperone HypA [Candidatus Margulisiibacteriota bacterium]